MTRNGMIYLLIGSLFWGLAAWSQSSSSIQKPTAGNLEVASDQSGHAKISNVAPDAPVITIEGLCEDATANNKPTSNCKTVITRAQFERVIDAVQPGMPDRKRRDFAVDYVDFLMKTKKAEQMGLDKGPNYEEQIRIARIQILSKALTKAIQEEASQISNGDIESYYRDNAARFETAEMDRIYIPKTGQALTSEQTMKDEADHLYARALSGEEFSKLQAEAYLLAGIKRAVQSTSIRIRSVSLPPNQVSVMSLLPGQVSPILADPNGYVIYRLNTKDVLRLDQVRDEIRATLRSQRMQEEMQDIEESAKSTLNELYFSR
jgi:hypothetical protein